MKIVVNLLAIIIGLGLIVTFVLLLNPLETLFSNNTSYVDKLLPFLYISPMILIGLFLIFGGSWSLNSLLRKKRCICSKSAYDKLTSDHTIGYFCRDHLLQKYSELFVKSPFNVVMVEYQPESISFPGYLYYPASEIDFRNRYDPNNKANEVVKQLLSTIKVKKCSMCNKQVSILFVSKEVSPFKKYKSEPREEFAQKGEYLCKEHTLERIIPCLRSSRKHFDTNEGLCLPNKEDGYQATIEY